MLELQVQSAMEPTNSLSSRSEAQFRCENKLMGYLLCLQEPNHSQSLCFLIAALQSLVLEYVQVPISVFFFSKARVQLRNSTVTIVPISTLMLS